jgi:hypothetical protein
MVGSGSVRTGLEETFDASDFRWLNPMFANSDTSGDVLIAAVDNEAKFVWMERRDLQWKERCRGQMKDTGIGSMIVGAEFAFVEAGGTLYRLHCEGSELVTQAESLEGVFTLFGVYGGILYTSQKGVPFDPLVSAFNATDLSPVASYDNLTTRPTDMTVSGNNLVFVGDSELTTLAPECK